MNGIILKKRVSKLLSHLALILFFSVFNVIIISAEEKESEETVVKEGHWEDDKNNGRILENIPISITKHSQHLTIQDSNPVNTITVKITSNETGTTVFENVYPQGQTSFIVIPMDGWSAGSYTIELFGRENNGYLWGTFQVLP